MSEICVNIIWRNRKNVQERQTKPGHELIIGEVGQ